MSEQLYYHQGELNLTRHIQGELDLPQRDYARIHTGLSRAFRSLATARAHEPVSAQRNEAQLQELDLNPETQKLF